MLALFLALFPLGTLAAQLSVAEAAEAWSRIQAAGRAGCLLRPLPTDPPAAPQPMKCLNPAALVSKDGSRRAAGVQSGGPAAECSAPLTGPGFPL